MLTFPRPVLASLATVAAVCACLVVASSSGASTARAATYKNCTALNKAYPHGVGKTGATDKVRGSTKPVTNFTRNTAVYNANTARDGDKDGIACEKR